MAAEELEKIKLSFDEKYLEQQLSYLSGGFSQFSEDVRKRINIDIIPEDALKRMWIANERLKEVGYQLENNKRMIEATHASDEAGLKRLEAAKSHLLAMQQHEAQEVEREKRGGLSPEQQERTRRDQEQGVIGGFS